MSALKNESQIALYYFASVRRSINVSCEISFLFSLYWIFFSSHIGEAIQINTYTCGLLKTNGNKADLQSNP